MDNKKRTALQAAAALVQNADLKGLFTGSIYKGPLKSVCVPGLNCYSCPGAIGSFPVGALQNSLSSLSFRLPYYVLGLLLFFAALMGRLVCGFLCPFGLLQDLLHRLSFPKKIRTFKGDMALRKVKYAVLLFFVILLPLTVKLTPFFCKYLCPSGTLSGILLALSDTTLFSLMGSRFAWKAFILAAVLLLSLLLHRPFCKYLCPLGAFYGLFNKVSLFRILQDPQSCIGCGACARVCEMGIDPSKTPNHTECIRCTACITACSQKALRLGIEKGNKKQST